MKHSSSTPTFMDFSPFATIIIKRASDLFHYGFEAAQLAAILDLSMRTVMKPVVTLGSRWGNPFRIHYRCFVVVAVRTLF